MCACTVRVGGIQYSASTVQYVTFNSLSGVRRLGENGTVPPRPILVRWPTVAVCDVVSYLLSFFFTLSRSVW